MAHRRPRKKSTPDVSLNLNVRGMKSSATVSLNERSNALLRKGQEVFKLGLGQSPFPVPAPVVRELQANAFQKEYLPVAGLRQLRDEVAEYHRRSQGMPCSGNDILIGPGSKELMFLLQLVYYGDLLIPTPAWVSYAPQANIIGRRIFWLGTQKEDGWRVSADALEAHCKSDANRPRLFILNYPGNPTGGTFSPQELESIADVARKYRVILLSDEIYGELHHQGEHISISRYYPEGTIVSSGLSKWCGAGGWRLGTFAFPNQLDWLREAMAAVASETYTSTSAPIQYAAVRAFQGGIEIERYLNDSRRVLRALGQWSANQLKAADIHVGDPEGAFYLFADFTAHTERLGARGIQSSADLCHHLLEDIGVAVLPGEEFGRPKEELTLRLAYVDFDGAKALSRVENLSSHEAPDEDFLLAHCQNVTTAVERMVEWLAEDPPGKKP
jgi:aspartate aminotransferase